MKILISFIIIGVFSVGCANAYATENQPADALVNYSTQDERRTSPSVKTRIEFIQNTTDFVHNIIVGTPIEKVHGDTGVVSNITDYYFRVTKWAFGEPGDEIIIVRSQTEYSFEIGAEYTFAAGRIYSIFYDLYSVVSNEWIINNNEISQTDLNAFLESVGSVQPTLTIPVVIGEAIPSVDFINDNIDVALIATVSDIFRLENDFDVLSAQLDLNEIVYGVLRVGALDEFIRLRANLDP